MITLRLGYQHNKPEEAKALAEAILRNPGSCDAVWFSTKYGYPPLEVHEEYAKALMKSAQIFREAGISVSIQISNTFGHGPRIKATENCQGLVFENSPAEVMVGPKGKSTPYCFCWRGDFFRKYIADSTKIYADLIKPDSIWIDDDMRADTHGLGDAPFAGPYDFGCYCDNCINEFNKLHETNYTREELLHEMTYGNTEIRKQYIDFCRDGIGDFAAFVSKAVMEVSPDTVMAHQFAHWGNYMGQDDNHVLDSFYRVTGKAPMVRPGGGYYHDKEPLGQFRKALEISLANSVLPSYVKDKKAEVENIPMVAFGKSAMGTVKESTMHLAFGCTGLTNTLVQSPNEPLTRHERTLRLFSKVRPYWEKLVDISQTTYRGGVAIVHGEAPYLRKLQKGDGPFDWVNIPYSKDIKLLTIGIPLTHDSKKASTYLLHHDMIDHLTENDIEFLLSKCVLTDAESVQKLYERGYADRFRLKLTPLAEQGSAYEVFTEHEANKYATTDRFSEAWHFRVPMTKYAIDATDDSTEVLGTAVNSITNEELGSATVIASTFDKNGIKESSWVVSGYCVWSDIVSESKRNQLLNAIDYISPLPAKLISAEQCVVIPCVNHENKTAAVTIASASIGGSDKLEIIIRNPSGNNIIIMSSEVREIKPISKTEVKEGIKLTLPELIPYEIITIFTE